jgi:DNA-binding transcriptional MerR regulator
VRIGELSRASGASVRSLRHYEERGLIESVRSASGQRTFDDSTIHRVIEIRRLLAVGLGTAAIRDVLPCLADPGSQTTALTFRLLEERDRLSREIQVLLEMRDRLDEVIVSAPQP